MSRATEIVVLAALFLLRLGIPVAITIGVCALLRCFDRKWEEEAQRNATQSAAPSTEGAPASSKPLPCWLIKGCSTQQRDECPAYLNQTLPCWLVRLRVEGRVPQLCANCDLFRSPTSSAV